MIELLVLALFTLLYFAAGKLGLTLAFVNPNVTAVWPPSGMALAAVLVVGYRVWPAIFLGAFWVAVSTSGSLPAALMIAVGNALEAGVGAYLITRFAHGRRVFEQPSDIVKFAAVAAIGSTWLSATIGTTSLVLNGLATWPEFRPIWFTWWLGAATGALIFAPVLILCADRSIRWRADRMFEGFLLLAAIVTFGMLVFGFLSPANVQGYPLTFFALPIVVWAALRFGPRESSIVAVVLSAISCWGTIHGFGPFTGYTHNESLLVLQIFVAMIAITSLISAVTVCDIVEHKRVEEALRKSQFFLEQAQEVGGIGSWVSCLREGKKLWWSRECYRIFGLSEGTVIDNDFFFTRVHPEDVEPIRNAVQEAIATRQPYSIDHRICLPDGSERWVSERANVVFDSRGHPLDLIGVVQDISERKRAEETIERLAYCDALTGLPNRTSLFVRVKEAIFAVETSGETLALMLVNIRDFREVNDTLGHEKGDLFLIEIAKRLRKAFWDLDVIARLAGDEFAILLPRLARRDHIDWVVSKVADALEPVIVIAGVPIKARSTIGVALFPEHGRDVDTLYQHADVALNVSATRHKAYTLYDAAFDRYDPQRLSLMAQLQEAIRADQLQLYYQPKVSLVSEEIVGVEALVRWQHPTRGFITPDEFIPAAEKTGLIDELTLWVLRSALHQASCWRKEGFTLELSVNISARNLREDFLAQPMRELLEKTGHIPGQLVLEITESAIMLDPVGAIGELEALRKLGVQIAIDDFGTGYCSLAYLKQLPVSHLKIDKSFVINMRDPNNTTIVRSTVELAHNLGLSVTAEGVENETTLVALKLFGCDLAQGYYLSRPLSAEAFSRWMLESNWKKRLLNG